MRNVILLLFSILVVLALKVQSKIICKQYGAVALVNENEPVNFVVFTPSCTDTSGGTLSYSIKDGKPKRPYKKKFKIDANGNIKIKANLNADFLHKYSLDIGVTSTTGDFDVIKIAVKVLDYNDNSPVLKGLPSVVKLSEDKPIGYKVSTCEVRDKDKQDIHQFILINTTAPDANIWYLDKENCDLYINHELDYEHKTSYKLTIHAVDFGVPPRTSNPETMIIYVTDTNDNYPVCPQYYKVVNVSLDQAIGVNIGGIVCSDKDSGVNGIVKYSLSASNSVNIQDKFQVDPSTGDISLKAQLDYDTLKICEVKIDVSDSGTVVSLTSTVTICIIVSEPATVVPTTAAVRTVTTSTSTLKPISSAEPITGSEDPMVTEKTNLSFEPTVSNQPTITEEPTLSKEPKSTDIPTVSLKPSVSEEPNVSHEPFTVTKKPHTTEQTSVSEPTVGQEPNASQDPIVTDKQNVSDEPNVSPQTHVSDAPTVSDKQPNNIDGRSHFIKGLGAGIGLTLAVAVVLILVMAVVYKCRNRSQYQSNPVLYAANSMKIVSGIPYQEFDC